MAQALTHDSSEEVAVAIGPVVERFSDIPTSYHKANGMLKTYGGIRKEKIISYEDDMKEGELSPTNPFKIDLAERISQTEPEAINDLVNEIMSAQGTAERTQMYRFCSGRIDCAGKSVKAKNKRTC